MKGQVKIILKSPNGDIVKEVEQTNRVFDIPKKIMAEMFPLTIQNFWKSYTTNSSSTTMGSCYYYLSILPNIKDWFRGIKVNDEFFEEDGEGHIVDSAYKDWKIPQVYGSDNTTLANPSNTRYTYANTNYSVENNNIKKLYYSWTMPAPADPQNPQTYFTMRSISLCHYDAIGRQNSYGVNNSGIYRDQDPNTFLIWKYGNFYFGLDASISNYYNMLYKSPTFEWANRRFNYTKHLTVSTNEGASIYPLYNNQIALLRYLKDITTDYTSSYFVKYISIMSNDDGGLLRQFHVLQFEGMGSCIYASSANNYMYPVTTYMVIVTTPNKNYLVAYTPWKYGYEYHSSSSQREQDKNPIPYKVWEIPNTQVGYDLLVPCVAERTQDTSVVEGKEYYTQTWDRTNVPGEYVDESRYRYTLVENPTGNPYSKGYYEITKGNDGTQIPYIELSGDSDVVEEFTTLRQDAAMYEAQQIDNKLILNRYILTFTDNDVSVVKRWIRNSADSWGVSLSWDGRYIGLTKIPGLQYGLGNYNGVSNSTFPVWYNTSCMNLSEPIDIPEGYTLTVEYTITAN